MAYVAGWDHGATELRVYATTRDVANTFPEVFGEIGEQRTPPRELELAELVAIANTQWHDHQFVFRLAWSWEIDAATSAPPLPTWPEVVASFSTECMREAFSGEPVLDAEFTVVDQDGAAWRRGAEIAARLHDEIAACPICGPNHIHCEHEGDR